MEGGFFHSVEGDGSDARCSSGVLREPTPPLPEPHQPSDDEDQDQQLVVNGDRQQIADKPRTPNPAAGVKRPRNTTGRASAARSQFGGKRPYYAPIADEDDEDVPNLAEYFSRFDTSLTDDIKTCRSYASYLAQSIKSVRGELKK